MSEKKAGVPTEDKKSAGGKKRRVRLAWLVVLVLGLGAASLFFLKGNGFAPKAATSAPKDLAFEKKASETTPLSLKAGPETEHQRGRYESSPLLAKNPSQGVSQGDTKHPQEAKEKAGNEARTQTAGGKETEAAPSPARSTSGLQSLAAQKTAWPTQPREGQRHVFSASEIEFAVRFIPAGRFLMGRSSGEAGRFSKKSVEKEVRISRGFWMLETEVTRGQYQALTGKNPASNLHPQCGSTCPVDSVSWREAVLFADALSHAEGLPACVEADNRVLSCQGWRLPTEAEWEYAARAGSTDTHSGEEERPPEARSRALRPVGSKKPNAWGLHDMLGSLMEWTLDIFGSYRDLPAVDPFRWTGGSRRTIRGSATELPPGYAPMTRSSQPPDKRFFLLGFRLIRLSASDR